ncbi:MAG: hypothetical protein KDC98_04920 [Planctomycetes bacterium]|nr:hypothetical protein [Planctomycetota bacterium]
MLIPSSQRLLRLAAVTAMLCVTASAQFTFTLAQAKTAGNNGPPCGPFIQGGAVTVSITYQTLGWVGRVPVAPAVVPTYTGNFYDEDLVFDDCVTPLLATAAFSGWTFVKTSKPDRFGRVQHDWSGSFTIPGPGTICDCDDLPGFNPADPYVDVSVTIGGVTKLQSIAVPGLPPIGDVDLGLQGPSGRTTVGALAGRRVAAFSRGYDDIAALGSGAALYFASDRATEQSSIANEPGRVFVLDAAGNLWPEAACAASLDPDTAIECELEYLNVNTTPATGGSATSELYFVEHGSDRILYATSDPDRATLFLDLATGSPIEAIAVQDIAPRGVWSNGDAVLFVRAGESVIKRQQFGLPPLTLNVAGIAFDGNTTIVMDHFGPAAPQPQLTVGNILALSVTARSTFTPQPPDRAVDFLAESCIGSASIAALWPANGAARGVAVDPSRGATYVLHQNRVDVYDSARTLVRTLAVTIPAGPDAIAVTVDPQSGNLWIADRSRYVHELRPTGVPTGRGWSTVANVPDLSAVAWLPETGDLVAGSGSGEFVVRYDGNGVVRQRLALRSPRVEALGSLAYDPLRRTLILGDANHQRALGVDLQGHVQACWSLRQLGLATPTGFGYDDTTATLFATTGTFIAELAHIPEHAAVNVLPTPCVGPAGPLVLAYDTTPELGGSFRSTATGFATGSLGYAAIGFDSPGTSLVSLHPAGLPGCDQLSSLESAQLAIPTAGSSHIQFQIPNAPSLSGLLLYHQFFQIQLDAFGTLMSLSSSNGLAMIVGY